VNPADVDGSFIATRQNSHRPAVGVPEPPPTEEPEVRGTTTDSSAGGVVPKVTGWLNVPAHWFEMLIAKGSSHPRRQRQQ